MGLLLALICGLDNGYSWETLQEQLGVQEPLNDGLFTFKEFIEQHRQHDRRYEFVVPGNATTKYFLFQRDWEDITILVERLEDSFFMQLGEKIQSDVYDFSSDFRNQLH